MLNMLMFQVRKKKKSMKREKPAYFWTRIRIQRSTNFIISLLKKYNYER